MLPLHDNKTASLITGRESMNGQLLSIFVAYRCPRNHMEVGSGANLLIMSVVLPCLCIQSTSGDVTCGGHQCTKECDENYCSVPTTDPLKAGEMTLCSLLPKRRDCIYPRVHPIFQCSWKETQLIHRTLYSYTTCQTALGRTFTFHMKPK